MAWLRHVVTNPPAAEPFTADDAKLHCRIVDSSEDALIATYAKAARLHVENRCGAKLINQTVLLQCSSWNDLRKIPIYPLVSVTSIKYLDENNVEQTLDPSVYQVIAGRNASIYLKQGQSWPSLYNAIETVWPVTGVYPHNYFPGQSSTVPDAIRISAVFGFGSNGAAIPEPILLAMYVLVGTWYENREDFVPSARTAIQTIPDGVDALLADYELSL